MNTKKRYYVPPPRDVLEASIAERIAREAHANQVDQQGRPYIEHVQRVARDVETPTERAVAWLHDVIEDTLLRPDDLHYQGISWAVITAVQLLTRRPDHNYQDYIDHLIESGNQLALTVKLADLRDHLRLGCPERLIERYLAALGAILRIAPYTGPDHRNHVGSASQPVNNDGRCPACGAVHPPDGNC